MDFLVQRFWLLLPLFFRGGSSAYVLHHLAQVLALLFPCLRPRAPDRIGGAPPRHMSPPSVPVQSRHHGGKPRRPLPR
uniref:Putative secreted protein n=1 Tax=Ixodes ricinus TaxID=34613 RepID=A0A6B0U0M4_IXORI